MIGQHSGSGFTDQSPSGHESLAYPGRSRSFEGRRHNTHAVRRRHVRHGASLARNPSRARLFARSASAQRLVRGRATSSARAIDANAGLGTIDRGREGSIVAISREVLRARERAMGVWARAMTDGDFCVCVSRARADEHLGQGGYSARIRGDLSMRSVVGFRIRSRARARFGSRLPASSCAPRRAWGVRTMRNSV